MMQGEDSLDESKLDNHDVDHDMYTVVDVPLTGGPPWGFNLGGGSEFGRKLFVQKVQDGSVAGESGNLFPGDELLFVNEIKCSSRANAIETIRSIHDDIKLKVKRKRTLVGETRFQSKKSIGTRSFYDTVVEDMLDHMDDLSSSYYSERRSSLLRKNTKESRKTTREMKTVNENSLFVSKQENSHVTDVDEQNNVIAAKHRPSRKSFDPSILSERDSQKENRTPENRRASAGSRSFQKVTVKSVNVTAMVPKTKDKPGSNVETNAIEKDKGERYKQTKSLELSDSNEDRLRSHSHSSTPLGSLPPAGRSFKPVESQGEKNGSGIETPHMNVAKARAMFEQISKSTENLSTKGTQPRSSESPKVKPKMVTRRSPDPATATDYKPVQVSQAEQITHSHSHTRSLPIKLNEPFRSRPGRPTSAPNRRAARNEKAKSAYYPSEEERNESPTPPPPPRYSRSELLRSFRSSEQYSYESKATKDITNVRGSSDSLQDYSLRAGKSATLPASQMREAGKKYFEQVMKTRPGYRLSLGQMETGSQFQRTPSFGAGSSKTNSVNAENTPPSCSPDISRPVNEHKKLCNRSSSTTSLGSTSGYSTTSNYSEVFNARDDDNTIMSRLIREQRLNGGGSGLVKIEEEVRMSKKHSVSTGVSTAPLTRTISIQTDPVVEYDVAERGTSCVQTGVGTGTGMEFGFGHVKTESASTATTESSTTIDEKEHERTAIKLTLKDYNKAPAETYHEKIPSTDDFDNITEAKDMVVNAVPSHSFDSTDPDALPPPPEELLAGTPPEKEKPQRTINRKKRDMQALAGSSRNSSCVSTDSTTSTGTADSGIVIRSYSASEMSPRNSPIGGDRPEFDYDRGSRETLDEDEGVPPEPPDATSTPEKTDAEGTGAVSPTSVTPGSSSPNSRPDSMIGFVSPKIEELDQEKHTLISSMREKIEVLRTQEGEISDEIKMNEELGQKVRCMVESKATQTEFSKYELFIGELNKIVALLLSLTQRLHRYELMLQDLDISEEEDKQKRDTLIAKIEKLRSQHEEACYLRDVNDRRGENVATFLYKYCTEEEFADFQYYVDMKSQLALMQSEIREKVKLGEERLKALETAGLDWNLSNPDKS